MHFYHSTLYIFKFSQWLPESDLVASQYWGFAEINTSSNTNFSVGYILLSLTTEIFKIGKALLKNTINKALPLEISKSSEETGNINVEKMQPQLGVPGIASGARKPLSISNRQTSL